METHNNFYSMIAKSLSFIGNFFPLLLRAPYASPREIDLNIESSLILPLSRIHLNYFSNCTIGDLHETNDCSLYTIFKDKQAIPTLE
jgi:hypothetical protein